MNRGLPLPVPPVQKLGQALLLQGPAVVDVAYLLRAGIRSTSRDDGYAPHPRLLQLVAGFEEAAKEIKFAGEHANVRQTPLPAESITAARIDTREVAVILGITEQHVRRLADEIGCTRGPRGTYSFDPEDVHAYAAHRRSTKEIA